MPLIRLIWLLIILGTALSIPALMAGPDLPKAVLSINMATGLGLLAAMGVAWLLHIARYVILLRPYLKRPVQPQFALLSYLAIQFSGRVTPLGTGGPALEYLLVRHYGIPLHRAGAAWLMVVLTDCVAVFAWAGIILAHGPLPLRNDGNALLIVMGVMVVPPLQAALFLRWRRLFTGILMYLLNVLRLPRRWQRLAVRVTLRTADSLEMFIRMPLRTRISLSALAMIYWGTTLSLLWLAIRSAGGSEAWLPAMAVQIVASTAGHLSTLPGGAVGAEAAAAWYLVPALGATTAGIAILLWRGVVFYVPAIAGLVSLLRLQHHLHYRQPDPEK